MVHNSKKFHIFQTAWHSVFGKNHTTNHKTKANRPLDEKNRTAQLIKIQNRISNNVPNYSFPHIFSIGNTDVLLLQQITVVRQQENRDVYLPPFKKSYQ